MLSKPLGGLLTCAVAPDCNLVSKKSMGCVTASPTTPDTHPATKEASMAKVSA
jgi:hypothetical protein